MDILVLKMLNKSRDETKSWEKLARILLLKLAGELRYAKKQTRLWNRKLEAAKTSTSLVNQLQLVDQLEKICLTNFHVQLQANNTFQGAKEWWREYAPTQEKE